LSIGPGDARRVQEGPAPAGGQITQEIDMNKLASLARLACAGTILVLSAGTALGDNANPTPAVKIARAARSGYLGINGVDYYYEIRGCGEPVLLLHGGLVSSEIFGPVTTILSKSRQVITVDLQGHGRTALGDRPFKLESMGDDMGELVQRLGHARVDVLGYSLGGGVALRMAVQKPERVRRLVVVSAPFSDEGFYPDIREQQVAISGATAPMMQETPMYQAYVAVAPRPEDFPRLLDAVGDFMRQHYDWSAEVAKLTIPVMLVYGDSDMLRPEHVVEFYQLLGGGLRDAGWNRETMAPNRLAILPDLTHYEIGASPRLALTVLPFLNGPRDGSGER
jgi:pimeloyl-ACP methyl ester carboxylesterase